MTIDFGMLAAGNLLFSMMVFAIAAAMLLAGSRCTESSPAAKILVVTAINVFAAWASLQLLDPGAQLLIPVLIGLSLTIAAIRSVKRLSFTGAFLMAAETQFYLACLIWGASLIATAAVDPLTRALLLVGVIMASVYITISLIQNLEQLEVVCQRDPPRPVDVPRSMRDETPKVSLHVPVCSEPPELVMATLDALAGLQYEDYEVLVIDNNTGDPALWRPVQKHCEALGQRFRFFHVDRLPGAKAGALNFALRFTAPDAELIGIVDSDYKVSRNYIAALVGYFDDPYLGFVQTPHAYRCWKQYAYLRLCNWEYSLYLTSTLVSRNGRRAAITLGTMGLIRRQLLERIGGWAEWCLTEDSELALRVHAEGYSSIYINGVFGRGLIPETFREYKKQRFRWRYGSIQELRRHFRLYLPRPVGRPSSLSAVQKLSHLMHAVDTLKSVLEFFLLIVGGLMASSMLVQGQSIEIPAYAWAVFVSAGIVACLLKWQVFRRLGWSFIDTLGAHMARAALDHTFATAGLCALMTRSTRWRKTNKFRALPAGFAALGSVAPELLLGGITLLASMAMLAMHGANGMLLLLSMGGLLKAGKYLFAPVMVVFAEQGVRQRTDHSSRRSQRPSPDIGKNEERSAPVLRDGA